MNIKYGCVLTNPQDSGRRNVANVIVGILQPESPKNVYLHPTDYLDEVNISTVTQILDKAMHILWLIII